MSRYFSFLAPAILWLLCGCQENGLLDFTQDKYPGVDQPLWSYFESFEEEGARRGLSIDLESSQITAKIDQIDEDNVAGLCSYGYASPGNITIDQAFWNRSNNLSREMILFHELGHCFLKRDHKEDVFANGYCQSIMRSGTCCCRDAYTLENRTYYLDELFNAMLPQ